MKRRQGSQLIDAEGFGTRARDSFKRLRDVYRKKRMPRVTVRTIYDRVRDHDDTVSETTVGRWVGGRSVPESRERLAALAAALEVDPVWLLFGDEGLALGGVTGDAEDAAAALPEGPRGHGPGPGEGKRSRGRPRASER